MRKNLQNSGHTGLNTTVSAVTTQHISQQLDDIIRQEGLSGKWDKTKLLHSIAQLAPPDLLNIPEEEIRRRLRVLVVLEEAFGSLSEFSQEEMEQFDGSARRGRYLNDTHWIRALSRLRRVCSGLG